MMTHLPSGTVTFLFTDIEGSTQLWEQQPEAMKVGLARHDALLRQAIESQGGYVFKTVGDAFCAAFPTAPAGLLAALAVQRALASLIAHLQIRVRLALHTGVAEERDGDYFGPPLNRVARLISAGHGGQILLSLATQELVRDQLPTGTSLRDLGERRLKDLIRPEHIFQLLAPDLPTDFPQLKTLDTFRTNLPAPLTSFIGREAEMAEVKKLLASHRLVTLTGVGGTGKTRLALQAVSALLDDFPDGVWFIELASVTNPELVLQTVASKLQLREQAERSAKESLTDFLETRTVLLLLDNCEHLIQPCAQLADHLLQHCARLKILTTAREPLGLMGEVIWSVPSFSMPPSDRTITPEMLEQFEAVKLFVERACAVQPNFELNAANSRAVAQICTRLDGIPLALELAAARVRGMNVEQIASRLDNRFRLLTGGSRTALPRQQTLSALVDWSYNLLLETERLLFHRLAVFIGPFTLEAAENVCNGDGIEAFDVLDLLQRLVDKSLVITEERHGETYYRMLETIRQYGRDKLLASEAAEALANQHAHYYLKLAEAADYQVRGPDQVAWLRRLGVMQDNLRSALEWVTETRQTETALQIAHHLSWFWLRRSEFQEARQWFERTLTLPDAQAYPEAYTTTLIALAHHVWLQLGAKEARPIIEQALPLARAQQREQTLAGAFAILCLVLTQEDRFEEAQVAGEESMRLFEKIQDHWGKAFALFCCALGPSRRNEHAVALPLYYQVMELFKKVGDKYFQRVALRFVGAHELKLFLVT